jgi:hypothetical protein
MKVKIRKILEIKWSEYVKKIVHVGISSFNLVAVFARVHASEFLYLLSTSQKKNVKLIMLWNGMATVS